MTEQRIKELNEALLIYQKSKNSLKDANEGVGQTRKGEYPQKMIDAIRHGLTKQQQLSVATLVASFAACNHSKIAAKFEAIK